MDYEKLNPCGYPAFVKAWTWAETGCWCCTSLRGWLVGASAGVVIGLAAAGAWAAALIAGAIMVPVVMAALVVARRVWQESYAKDAEEAPK